MSDSVEDVVRSYVKYKWDNIKEPTRYLYKRSADRLISEYGSVPAARLNPQHVLDMQLPQGIKSQVMNLASASINWAHRSGMVQTSAVWSKCKVPNKGEWEAWTTEDIEKVKSTAPFGVMRDVVLFAAYTGMRRGDILNMNQSYFYSRNDTLRLSYTQSKTGVFIDMPLAAAIRDLAIIRETMDGNSPIQKRLTQHSFYKVYQRYCSFAGVRKPFHGLRKFCATRLAEAGCSMPEIMSITGHESTTTAMKYIRSANKKILTGNAIARIDNAEGN